jgi:predicted metal-binding membrane protein
MESIEAGSVDSTAVVEASESGLRTLVRANPVGVAAVLVGATLVSWIVAIGRMRGMDMGPGTDLGAVGWYVGLWVTMMAAMMLPSAAPMVLMFSRIARERARRGRAYTPTWTFVAGYLAAWTTYGLAAFGVCRVVAAADLGFLAWNKQGPYVAGAAIVLAGLYQLTPLKTTCLQHCRSPLQFILHDWREGSVGAVRMGAKHGAYCIGCCWGLMLLLFTLGVMSLTWMAVLAGVIFAEKAIPGGWRLTRPLAIAFVALGVWVMVSSSSVPGLTQPGGGAGTRMQMEMKMGG